MTSSLEGEGGGRPKDDMWWHDDMGVGGKGLMTKYPLFNEILAKPMTLYTFQGSYQT